MTTPATIVCRTLALALTCTLVGSAWCSGSAFALATGNTTTTISSSYAPLRAGEDQTIFAIEGDTVTLDGIIEGGIGDITYYWEVSEDGANTWLPVPGEGLRLELADVAVGSKVYRLTATDGTGATVSMRFFLSVSALSPAALAQRLFESDATTTPKTADTMGGACAVGASCMALAIGCATAIRAIKQTKKAGEQQ